MANLKRAAALTLSAAMFLQPMTASAATWGNIMSAIRNGQKYTDGKTSAEVNEQGELTVSGGSLDDGMIMRGDNDGFKWVSSIILKNIDVKWENASGVGIYVEKSGTEDQKYRFTVGENATVRGMVIINAGNQKTYSKGTEIELNIEKNAKIRMGNVQVNAINGGSVTSTNQGWIQGEYMGCADGADSTADLTNLEGGQIAALDIFARGENAQMTAKNEGSAGELLANALAGGATTATNDGDVSLRTSGWSKGEGSSLTITNNGESGTMSAEAYLDGKASLTNNGLADGGMGGYTDGGRVDLVNNGEVNGNMAVGAEKEGHVSADNRESGTVYGDLKGWTDGVGSTAVISNSGDVAGGKPQLNGALMTLEARAPARISAVVALDEDSETYHDDETTPESVTSEEAKPGTAGEGVLSGERRGSGTVVVEDKNSGTTSVNGKKADAMLNVTSSTTQAEIQSQLAALPIWEKPGEYTVLIKCVDENDEVTYEAVTILVEEEKPAEPEKRADARPKPTAKRPYRKPDGEKRPYRKPDGEKRPFRKPDGEKRPYRKPDGEKRPFRKADGERPFRRADGEKRPYRKDGERPFRRADGEKRPYRKDGERPFRKADGEKRPYRKDGERPFRRDSARKPHFTGEKRSFRNKT